MNNATTDLLWAIGRTTLWLSAAGVVTAAALRLARANWPAAHRFGWLLVLLVGWAFLRLNVAVPWYDPAPPIDVTAEVPLNDLAVASEMVTTVWPTEWSADSFTLQPLPGPESVAVVAEPVVKPVIAQNWPIAVASVWLLGMIALVVAWCVGYTRFVRGLPKRREGDAGWQEQWSTVLGEAGMRRRIPLRVTEDVGPMMCRLPGGYELLVPENLWRDLDGVQRRAILQHELAHYLRGDVWKSLAVRLVALPHWFNPMAWLAVRRFDEAAEWACDLAATAESPATAYAKALLQLGSGDRSPAYGSSARGRALAGRIRRLLRPEQREDSMVKKTLIITCGLAVLGLAIVRPHLVAKESAVEPTDAAKPAEAKTEAVNKEEEATTKQQRALADDAKAAYELSLRHFDASKGTLDAVCNWSIRWLEAAQNAAGNNSEKIAAGKEHLKRVQDLQKKIKALFDASMVEFGQVATVNYFVADAERRLARLERQDIEPPASPLLIVPLQSGPARSGLLQQMVNEAEKAYVAHQAAYEAETVTFNTLYEWSLRWMEAQELAAADQDGRKAAVEAHWRRMRALQQKIAQMYAVGTRGGEAKDMAAANFYLAEAERRLADVQASPIKTAANGVKQVSRGTSPAEREVPLKIAEDLESKIADLQRQLLQTNELVEKTSKALENDNLSKNERMSLEKEAIKLRAQGTALRTRWEQEIRKSAMLHVGATTSPSLSRPQTAITPSSTKDEAIDVKIKIAELEGRLEQVVVQLSGARKALNRELSEDERRRLTVDVGQLEAEQTSVKRQLELQNQKLKQMLDASTKPTPQREPPKKTTSKLRYAGKDFDEWNEQLRNDLSLEQRKEAVNALAAFGAHGIGLQAAEAILDVMGDYRVDGDHSESEVNFINATFEAFSQLPADIAEATVLKALDSQNVNQRLFGLGALRRRPVLKEGVARRQVLEKLIADPDLEVRRNVIALLIAYGEAPPAAVDALREALKSNRKQDISWALGNITTGATNEQIAASLVPFAPRLVELSEGKTEVPGRGKMVRQEDTIRLGAAAALHGLGSAAVPELTKALQSNPSDSKLRTWIDVLEIVNGKAK
jgi:beta-lactamase regulating signal transducer with metallopeptidase domain